MDSAEQMTASASETQPTQNCVRQDQAYVLAVELRECAGAISTHSKDASGRRNDRGDKACYTKIVTKQRFKSSRRAQGIDTLLRSTKLYVLTGRLCSC